MDEKEATFWDLAEDLMSDPRIQRSTMMGFPCLRIDGKFFASIHSKTHDLIVKLPAERVHELVESGAAAPFAPAGKVFREWVSLETPDAERWGDLLVQARDFVAEL